MKTLGSERYILVMNEFFGSANELPFDLSHYRWPLRYTLDPENRSEKKKIKDDLKKQFVTALRAVVDSGILNYTPSTPATLAADRVLFNQFLEALPPLGYEASFLKDQDMGNSFRRSTLDPMVSFVDRWNNAQYEFFDSELESKRKLFRENLLAFLAELIKTIRPTGAPDIVSIGILEMVDQPHLDELQERLNDISTEVYKQYEDLIRAGRRILGPTENTK